MAIQQSSIVAWVGIGITMAVYGIQDIRRQTAYETKLDAIQVWQVEQKKAESILAVTNQKVDALNIAVEKLANNMDRFLEEIYRIKAHVPEGKR